MDREGAGAGVHRRDYFQIAAAGALAGGAATSAAAAVSEVDARSSVSRPHLSTTIQRPRDILVETLITWGASMPSASSATASTR